MGHRLNSHFAKIMAAWSEQAQSKANAWALLHELDIFEIYFAYKYGLRPFWKLVAIAFSCLDTWDRLERVRY